MPCRALYRPAVLSSVCPSAPHFSPPTPHHQHDENQHLCGAIMNPRTLTSSGTAKGARPPPDPSARDCLPSTPARKKGLFLCICASGGRPRQFWAERGEIASKILCKLVQNCGVLLQTKKYPPKRTYIKFTV